MTFLEKFISNIKNKNLFQQKDSLLIAVSGGADSTVLCDLCNKAGYNFGIAHCNFQLRNEESDRDEYFVKTLAEKYKVPFFVEKFEINKYANEHKLSIQEAARKLRYTYFEKIIKEQQFQYLLTAHHADDNVETVLMNFFKGSGIKGFRGILPKQKNIIRPLLFATRKDIDQYAQVNNIEFITDSSNLKNDYTRNYLRNELIPSLEKIYPTVSKNITLNIEKCVDIEYIYENSITKIKKSLLEIKGKEIHIPTLKLIKAKPLNTVIYEIISDYNFTAAQVSEVQKLLTTSSGKYMISATHRILKNRNWLIISAIDNKQEEAHILIEENQHKFKFGDKDFIIERCTNEEKFPSNPFTVLVDGNKITFPLLLRKWKQGDYFYPLGMDKKKKLSRFFIDQKLSIIDKEKVWVLESDKKIIWVVGLRIDDRFKITPQTLCSLKLSLTL